MAIGKNAVHNLPKPKLAYSDYLFSSTHSPKLWEPQTRVNSILGIIALKNVAFSVMVTNCLKVLFF